MLLKYLHITCAVLTALSFSLRGLLMLQDSRLLQTRTAAIAPHVIDAILLLTGLIMLFRYYLNLTDHGWLILKLLLVLVYIVAGMVALKRGRTRMIRSTALVISLAILGSIFYLAIGKPF